MRLWASWYFRLEFGVMAPHHVAGDTGVGVVAAAIYCWVHVVNISPNC